MLAYLARYTHRVAISNRRLISLDGNGVTFRFKDYRRDGAARYGTMTLTTGEFIRRFLLHVLPKGFHRIRHYGLLATGGRQANLARARALLGVAPPPARAEPAELPDPRPPCPCCGGHMVVLETLPRWLPTTWPATDATTNRQADAMTRHGPRPHHAVAPSRRPSNSLVPNASPPAFNAISLACYDDFVEQRPSDCARFTSQYASKTAPGPRRASPGRPTNCGELPKSP